MIRKIITVSVCMLLSLAGSEACTNFIVGKKASKDG